jgi:hypothetical protein
MQILNGTTMLDQLLADDTLNIKDLFENQGSYIANLISLISLVDACNERSNKLISEKSDIKLSDDEILELQAEIDEIHRISSMVSDYVTEIQSIYITERDSEIPGKDGFYAP